MSYLQFEITSRCGNARAGLMSTPRGEVQTPVFMPVGTRAAIKTIDTADIERLGFKLILANTYHLSERPGSELVEGLGGLHAFMDFPHMILTDSGGFQVFSLKPKIEPEGVTFRSVYDGSYVFMGPEESITIQQQLGSDIAMMFDVCSELPATVSSLRKDVEITLDWAQRARKIHNGETQALFGISQGGTDLKLRAESAARTAEIAFDGYAVGGLSVGESRAEMIESLHAAIGQLPEERPRYFMGIGDPIGLVEVVSAGVDMFDCVLPTRLARHGTALTSIGKINLKNKRYANDESAIDPGFETDSTGRYSKAYLRHLLVTGEPTGGRILTLSNLGFMARLVDRIRQAVSDGTLGSLRSEVLDVWGR